MIDTSNETKADVKVIGDRGEIKERDVVLAKEWVLLNKAELKRVWDNQNPNSNKANLKPLPKKP